MTNAERTNAFRQWTYISLIVGVIGAAAGFGIGVGRSALQSEVTVKDIVELKIQVDKNSRDRIDDRLLLMSIEKDISYTRKILERLEKQL